MKIGIFDSGLGGLVIARSIFARLPAYDYIYLGDTKNLPYGEKSGKQIYNNTKKAVEFLFKNGCELIVIACNTASALALRKLQQVYLPGAYPGRKILGVIVPTLEAADDGRKHKNISVIATTATINSHIYKKELKKISPSSKIYELATPKLVTFIEADSLQKAQKSLRLYLKTLQKHKMQALILGCTHYPILKKTARSILGEKIDIVSQDKIIPQKLESYLEKHTEVRRKLGKKKQKEFWVTSLNENFSKVAEKLFGKKLDLKAVKL